MRGVVNRGSSSIKFAVLLIAGMVMTVAPAYALPTVPDIGGILHTEYGKITVPRKIMNASAKRGVAQVGGTDHMLGQQMSMPPLPGDQAYSDSSSDPDRFIGGGENHMPDFGANQRSDVNIVLPPLKGLSQILNSSVTKDLLKELTAAETTVLMQTYMMVENGAATGFMGGMNIGSNLMSNLIQAQDFQMKLMDASDSTGKLKEAYVNRIASVMKTGNHKDVWPAALYIASGEDGKYIASGEDGKASTAPAMKDLTQTANGVGAFNLEGIKSNSQSISKTKKKFSEMLFQNSSSVSVYGQEFSNVQLNDLIQDFQLMVGDIEFEMKDSGSKYARDMELKFVAPAKINRCSSGVCNGDDPRRGLARMNWEEVQVAWTNINTLIYDLCVWKQTKPAQMVQSEPGKAETTTTTRDIGTKKIGEYNSWELASSPDITMTMNVIEQLFKWYEDAASTRSIICNELKLGPLDIPDSSSNQSSISLGTSTTTNLNDCGPKKGCLKNRVVLHLAYMIGRSRTLHTYRTLYNIAGRFVTDKQSGELLDRLFDRAFSGLDLNSELAANRERYTNFMSEMGKILQNRVGTGSTFVAQSQGHHRQQP